VVRRLKRLKVKATVRARDRANNVGITIKTLTLRTR
jgi:hypothetical protein